MLRPLLKLGLLIVSFGLACGQDQPTTAPSAPAAPSAQSYSERLLQTSTMLNAARAATGAAKMKMYQEVAESLDKLTKEDPRNIEVTLLTGEMYLDANRYTQASDMFRKVLAVEPKNFRALLGRAKVEVSSSVFRNAITDLQNALLVAPLNQRLDVLRLLAVAYGGTGESEKGLDAANQALAITPDDTASLQIVVKLQRERGKYELANDKAKELIERSMKDVKANPTDIAALKALDAAYDLQLSVLGYNRRDGMLQLLMERDARGNYIEQVRAKQEVAAAQVLDIIAETVYAQANVKRLLTIHDSLTLLQRSIEYNPKNPESHRKLARTLDQIGDSRGAVESYQRVLALEPNDAEAADYLHDKSPASQPAVQE